MHYGVYGLRVCSNASLPQLAHASFSTRDLLLRVVLPGESGPPFPAGARLRVRFPTNAGCDLLVYDAGDAHILRWDGKCDFFIDPDGAEVVIAPRPGINPEWVRSLLYGMVLAYVLHMRGVPNLHGSAVATPGGAIAFLAESGTGKSTLAARFAHAGFPLMTDDVLALQTRADGFVAQAGFPWISLSLRSVEGVLNRNEVPKATFLSGDKYRLPLDGTWGSFGATTAPVVGIFILTRGATSSDPKPQRISQTQALSVLVENTLCLPFLRPDAVQRHLRAAASVAAQVRVWRLPFPGTFARTEQLIETVMSAVRQPGAVTG